MKKLDNLERLSGHGKNICFCGDFNCSVADNCYFTRAGREALMSGMGRCGLTILTREQPECIDYIAVSGAFLTGAVPQVAE